MPKELNHAEFEALAKRCAKLAVAEAGAVDGLIALAYSFVAVAKSLDLPLSRVLDIAEEAYGSIEVNSVFAQQANRRD